MPFVATWMDLEIMIISEVSQANIIYHLICGNKKNDTNELIYKIETNYFIVSILLYETRIKNLWLPGEKGEERRNRLGILD